MMELADARCKRAEFITAVILARDVRLITLDVLRREKGSTEEG